MSAFKPTVITETDKSKVKFIKLKHVRNLIEKKVAVRKSKVNKQLLVRFPEFQQFKVEIRKIPEWCLDWDALSTK